MAMAVFNFQKHKFTEMASFFVKRLFYSLKVSALLEDLVAEDSCKGSCQAVENV